MKAINLKTNYRRDPVGISDTAPFLSWQCEEGIKQTAYQIVALSGDETVWDSGRVDTGKMHAAYGGAARSRERISWKVRLWDEHGEAGDYSNAAFFEMGLLAGADWQAKWITPELEKLTAENYDCSDAINRLAKAAWEERRESSRDGGAGGLTGGAQGRMGSGIETAQNSGISMGAAAKQKQEMFVPHQPSSVLRRIFTVTDVQKPARLYITALGLYEAYVNGRRVGDAVLTPGTSNYACEIPFQTYDVTGLLKEGENEIMVLLGDGWYRSTSGVDGDRCLYGDTSALLCQLECGGRAVLVTDETWEASQDGPLRQNDLQQGEVYDARRTAENWHGVKALAGGELGMPAGRDSEALAGGEPGTPAGREPGAPAEAASSGIPAAPPLCILKSMDTVPIREQESFEGRLFTAPDGSRVIDFGQNLAGYVEFWIEGRDGAEIRLWHGETLDKDGNFTQENFEDRKRHKENGTYQMISYICKEGANHYKPRFTIMGFRYAKVETELDLSGARFTAHAVYSDMAATATFSCGNELVNQLFRNSVWSQKGNFCDVPTDCPTRERAAWTGDAGIFAEAGLTLMDSAPVFLKWLRQCRLGQLEDGRLPNIAPPNNRPSYFSGLLYGSAAWGDACILVPYAIYRQSGDLRVLRDNYPMMKRWFTFLAGRADSGKTDEEGQPLYGIHSGVDYGEWCEPGSNPMASMRNGNFDVATAYLANSGRLLSEIALLLGEEEDAERFVQTEKGAEKGAWTAADAEQFVRIAEGARRAYRMEYTDHGTIQSERQCQYIRPIRFGLLDEEESSAAADELDKLVRKNDYHLNTGFLTTPHLCGTLAEYGHTETAYRVLLQETAPGWLYAVKQGATTIWETWDGQASQNHYSYGAISGWLISGVCGIRYSDKKTVIAPAPHPLLTHACACYDSPAGRIESEWIYRGEEWMLRVKLPANLEAEVLLPDGTRRIAGPGEHKFVI